MYRVMTGVAAFALLGAAALPLPASAADHQVGATTQVGQGHSTEFSSQRRWHRHYGYGGPRRYWGPRYGYYRPYRYGYYGDPYGYYGRPYYPGVAVGIGPFGFRFF